MSEGAPAVAFSSAMLDARCRATEGGRLLTVYKSVIVKTTGRLFRPVRELLEVGCVSEGIAVDVEDIEMMGGRAVRLVYKLWGRCPGCDVEHVCRAVPESRGSEEDAELPVSVPDQELRAVPA